jgi:pimeloyl-ACP methyl ester carboxylesterase
MPLADPPVADEASLSGAIELPHPDIELRVNRSPLTYSARLPAAGINAETGLVIYLGGYGMDPRGGYAQNLLTYLANTHNCVAATLDYFGVRLTPSALGELIPHPDFFKKLNEHYGIAITAPKGIGIDRILAGVADLLKQNGITHLHDECLLFNNSAEYNSMGFLPALDGLQVVHRLLTTLPVNKARLFILGTSYGGYIANIMAKLAPNTFRMIIDNSGFSSAEDDKAGVAGWQKLFVNGVSMLCKNVRHWSLDPREANFFSVPRQAVRDLHRRDHVIANSARIYAYHAANDPLAPTARKLALREVYRDRIAYELTIIDDSQVDGRIFKNLAHGMNASMRGIFDLSYEKFTRDGGALSDTTDFDLGSEHVFACGREDYVVRFSSEDGAHAALRAA